MSEPEFTSDEVFEPETDAVISEDDQEKDKSWEVFNLWNGMLMASLAMIGFATIWLLFVIREYSPSWPFGGSPWNTGG